MTPYAGPMAANDALDLLSEAISMIHAKGRDRHVEALTMAMDALTWFPLKSAPRDGSKILLAVAPLLHFNLPGFVAVGRWVEPSTEMLGEMGKNRRERFEAAGGWWSSSKSGKPYARAVLGWRPLPEFDFEAVGYVPDEVTTVGGSASAAAGGAR